MNKNRRKTRYRDSVVREVHRLIGLGKCTSGIARALNLTGRQVRYLKTKPVKMEEPSPRFLPAEKQCKWPIGNVRDPDFSYCDKEKVICVNKYGRKYKSYCLDHARESYGPSLSLSKEVH